MATRRLVIRHALTSRCNQTCNYFHVAAHTRPTAPLYTSAVKIMFPAPACTYLLASSRWPRGNLAWHKPCHGKDALQVKKKGDTKTTKLLFDLRLCIVWKAGMIKVRGKLQWLIIWHLQIKEKKGSSLRETSGRSLKVDRFEGQEFLSPVQRIFKSNASRKSVFTSPTFNEGPNANRLCVKIWKRQEKVISEDFLVWRKNVK